MERGLCHQAEGQKSPTIHRGDLIHALFQPLRHVTPAGHTDPGQTGDDLHPARPKGQNCTLGQETDPIPEVALDLGVGPDPTQGQGQEVTQDGLLRDLDLIPAPDPGTGQDPEPDLGQGTGHSPHITEKGMHQSLLMIVHKRVRILCLPLLKLRNPNRLHLLRVSRCCP